MRVLRGIKPYRVFEIFEDICSIPHGSGNTKAISDYCVNFAKKQGLWCCQDELNNVVIKKPAFAGFESHEAVVLQGHLDMVCEKDADCGFDFLCDGLNLKVDGDFVSTNGTTLGGDDGIAVAIALSILEDNTIKSPELQVIFTTDEETGMYGAKGLDTSCITAKNFINIDSEQEGVFTVGCAGGARVDIILPIETENTDMPAYKVTISGLTGGHSGTEIDKGRLNANKVLGEFLKELGENIRISDISGGSKDNAIPTTADCVVFTNADIYTAADGFSKNNTPKTDSGLKISVSHIEKNTAFSVLSSQNIIKLLCDLPTGVISMNEDIKKLVETSLNMGIVKTEGECFSVSLSVRSSKSASKAGLIEKLKAIAKSFGALFSVRGDYPAWEYRKSSPLRDKMTQVFEDIYGKKPKIEIIHAGLECGIFAEKIENIDAVSIGPDLYDIHTPRERMSISSVQRTYEYICRVLEAL